MSKSNSSPGWSRRTTLTDVARQAGVSPALVSLVVRGAPGASPANRKKILRIARELGYVPDSRARALRQERSRLLGVMFDVQQPFEANLVEGIYAAAEPAGYDVVLSAVTNTRGEDRAVSTLLADRCEALLLVGPLSSTAWLANVAARLPTVVLARTARHPNLDVVRTADAKGIGLAVDHLVRLGHNRIVHIDGGDASGAEQRRRGYRTAMTRLGLRPCLVTGGSNERSGAEAMTRILAGGDPPTSILAFNDRCATGVLDVLHRSDIRVPDDISIVGFDDTHIAGLSHVDLTTVRQDAPLMARLAVERAISRLTPDEPGGPTTRDIVIPPMLVVRGTTTQVSGSLGEAGRMLPATSGGAGARASG